MRQILVFLVRSSTVRLLMVVLGFTYLAPPVNARQNMRFIKATSKKIKVLEGDFLQDGELVPDLKPDTYYFHPSPRPKKIAYYTDVDSLVLWVKAGDTFNFAIVFNEKDTCYQRITSNNPNKVFMRHLIGTS